MSTYQVSSSPISERSVLFVPHFNHTFQDMLPVALRLREQHDARPLFLIAWEQNQSAIAACEEHGIPYDLGGKAVSRNRAGSPTTPRPALARAITVALKGLAKRLLSALLCLELFVQFQTQGRAQRQARQVIERIRPACVVLFDDRHPNLYGFLIQAANRQDIPTLLFPNESVDSPLVSAEQRLQRGWTLRNLSFPEKLIYRFLRSRLPNMSAEWRGEEVMWCWPVEALVAHMKGFFPSQPWVRGGSDVTCFAVQSNAYREVLIEAGVNPGKLVVTGYPLNDRLAAMRESPSDVRLTLCGRFGIPSESTVVCFADQINAQYSIYGPIDVFIEDTLYAVRCLLDASPNSHVIFKMHPRNTQEGVLSSLADHPRLTVVQDADIREVIAGSDLFVTFISSSIYSALALNKPIIAFDFRSLGIYDVTVGHIKAVYHARTREQFAAIVDRTMAETGSPGASGGLESSQVSNYVVSDGKAVQRLTDLIAYLVEHPLGDPGEAIRPVKQSHPRETVLTRISE